MEGFLSTLPPYVHEFLGKHPPTDVFNLLKELVCFAVLYSEDRDRINSTTTALLKKRQDKEIDQDAIVPESHTMEVIKEETKAEMKPVVIVKEAKPTYNVRTGELIQTDKSKIANTFPEWWGHQESEPQVVPSIRKEEFHDSKAHDNKTHAGSKTHADSTAHEDSKAQVTKSNDKPEAYGSSWISWDATPTDTNTHHHRLERARSQIIPDLRSYPDEDNARLTNSHTSPAISSTLKRHSTLNLKSSVSPPARTTVRTSNAQTTTKASNRFSAPVCESPTTASKFILTATKKIGETNSPSNSTGTTTPTRSASITIKQPRPNAAMRARAEHARLQQEEFSKKKTVKPMASSNSLRLKERVKSGVDWDTIKRDRRNTVTEPVSKSIETKPSS